MKKNYLITVFSIMIFLISGRALAASGIDVLACPEGCITLQMDMYLSNEISKTDPDFRFNPIATSGYLYNLIEMKNNPDRWKTTVFGTNDDVLAFAPMGGKDPFTKFIPESVNLRFKLLYGTLWEITGHFFITLDAQLKNCKDLKGKKLGVGLETQSDWGENPTLDLKYGYEIGTDNTELLYLGPAKLAKALISGEVQAIVAGLGVEPGFESWLPAIIFTELRNWGKPLYYIGHDETIIEKIDKKLGTAYIPVQIPANTMPGQTQTLKTMADGNFRACHESFPEELAYKLVKFAAQFGPKMRFEVGIWQTWSPEMMVAGLTEENAHPGAIRAFKELGWWDLTKKFKPVVLPK